MSSNNQNEYVLGRNSTEYQRLAAQAQMWTPATQSALARAGVSPGMKALDVGCGTGAVMRLIADVVGATGRVTGLDSDTALGAEAMTQLRSAGPDIFEFVAGDLAATTPIDGLEFDLVLARLVVVHTHDPCETLRRLWRWVKPGGVLLVMDQDMTSARTLPAHPVVTRAFALTCNLFRSLGKDIEIGPRMPELFRRAGLGLADGCDVWSHIRPNPGGCGMVRAILASLRKASLAGGHVDAATLDQIDAELAAVPPDQFLVRLSDMVATWKRKVG
jgi:ubiquinone/menaquinone biosynthesis C-methylase UbiE